MAKNKKWTNQQLQVNQLKYERGYSSSEIAKELSIPLPLVGRLLRSYVEYQEHCKCNPA